MGDGDRRWDGDDSVGCLEIMNPQDDTLQETNISPKNGILSR